MFLDKNGLWEAFVALPYSAKVVLLEVLISEPSSRNVLVHFFLGGEPEDAEIPFPLVGVESAIAQEKPVARTTPTQHSTVSIPSPELVNSALAPAPHPAPIPGPPRVIESAINQDDYKKWVGLLEGVVSGNNIPWSTLQGLTVKLVQSGQQFSEEDFELFFAAARKADRMNKHIISEGASAIFKQAPANALANYLFETGGKFDQISNSLAIYEAGHIPTWLVATMFVFESGIEALNEKGALREEMVDDVVSLAINLNKLNGPRKLIERLGKFGYSDDRPAPPATATLGERLGPDIFEKLSARVATHRVN